MQLCGLKIGGGVGMDDDAALYSVAIEWEMYVSCRQFWEISDVMDVTVVFFFAVFHR